MTFVRKVLSVYRKIQYKVYGRSEYGVIFPGVLCTHTPFDDEVNHGDVVHPCVRYIPEGYLGHKWWMVYTPYYAANDTTENPILCYGDNETEEPPTHWIVKYQVQGQPSKGYNSDPTLLFDNGKLYVMWRENLTERCEKAGFVRATFGAVVEENNIGAVFGPFVGTKDFEVDAEVSPTFIKDKNGRYRCLATHLRFHSPFIASQKGLTKKLLSVLANVSDILGIWSQQKAYGMSQWSCDNFEGCYKLDRTIKFSNCNKLYRPWHMDIFEYNNNLYAVVQSNQCNADICLAESTDGIHFRMFDKPLMTNKSCGKIGIYKPCAGIVGDTLYLYYTAQDLDNRKLNKLYLTKFKFANIL